MVTECVAVQLCAPVVNAPVTDRQKRRLYKTTVVLLLKDIGFSNYATIELTVSTGILFLVTSFNVFVAICCNLLG